MKDNRNDRDSEVAYSQVNMDANGKKLTGSKFRWALFTTIVIFLSRICMGIYYELSGPTLPDLKDRLGVNYEEISRILVWQNAAFLVSALVGGFLSDVFKPYIAIIIFISQVVALSGVAGAPWCTTLVTLGICYFLTGFGCGTLGTGGNAWIVWLWGSDATAPCYAFHFGFGIGATISPQLAKPFLSKTITTKTEPLNGTDMVTSMYPNATEGYLNNTITTQTTSLIEYPYTIGAIATMVVALLYLVLLYHDTKEHKLEEEKKRTKAREMDDMRRKGEVVEVNDEVEPHKLSCASICKVLSPHSCTPGEPIFGGFMIALILTFHTLVVAGERSWGKFLFTYAVENKKLNMNKDDASNLQSAFWFCFLAGRGLPTLVGKWIPPNLYVTTVLILYLTNAVVLAIFGGASSTVLWICSCIFGFLVAPIFPGGITVYNQYIDIQAMIFALSEGGAGLGGMFWQWMSGFLINRYGPESLLYHNVVYICLLIVVYCIIQVIGIRRKRLMKSYGISNEKEEM
ncbi:unnamed protein product [Owenia fusiformis]|uniref:Uncharacterized protein n=1 Tax=Owenia fusiformis TaxID=6347 RepID=A0A8J1UK69_OWEFU|nr:unnamed protein product [Owenia fusiformis]